MTWQVNAGLRIAIDGPSGSGKGTIATLLGQTLALPVLDTGLLYRYLGWQAEENQVSLHDENAVLALIPQAISQMDWRAEGIFLAQNDCTSLLRGEDAGSRASLVAAMPQVRASLLGVQRQIARLGCVMDGRDIGTVVLPDAEAKFFLTASQRERARRRWAQLKEKDQDFSIEQIADELRERDARDMARECAPLEQAVDAIRIDSTTLRMDDVIDRMMTVLERRKLIIKTA
ncbi:MAG: cytidylate kinase [Zetaproteobacteria bacterium CG2_30_46_52]|nr:MAG: cytidylate kinase [Zetaproteobacteria bacterium CG2_30_46_52]